MLTGESSLVSGHDMVMDLFIVAASTLGFSFGVRALTEMKMWCIEGM